MPDGLPSIKWWASLVDEPLIIFGFEPCPIPSIVTIAGVQRAVRRNGLPQGHQGILHEDESRWEDGGGHGYYRAKDW